MATTKKAATASGSSSNATVVKVDLPPDYNLPIGEELPEPEPTKLPSPSTETLDPAAKQAEKREDPPRIKRA